MYRYRCKILKVIDGDTVDVDIDLIFQIARISLQSAETEVCVLHNLSQTLTDLTKKQQEAADTGTYS